MTSTDCKDLLDHLVGALLEKQRYFDAKRLGGLEVDHQLDSSYYNQTRTHLALRKDAPLRRAVQESGTIMATPILFGLHHRYARI
jgi:hypothetical protein